MRSLLIAILVLVPLYTFAQDAKMPAEAKKVIDKYEASVEVARKAFDASVAKARDQALKDLKPIQVAETKKGNLDGAMIVKSKVDELSTETSKPISEGDLARPTIPSVDPKVFYGKWKVTVPGGTYSGIWEFKENGIAERSEGNGTFEMKDGKIVITWPNNNNAKDAVNMPKLGATVMDGVSAFGFALKFEKISKK
jgi:hypothetical protein